MSFLKSLFGGSKGKSENEQGIEVHLAFLNALRRPAIALSASFEARNSWIGGLPSLPDNDPWPEWKGVPLAFLCQLDLGEIPQACERHGLPPTGMLFFFYNQEQETWGFDPKDERSWRVIYTPEPAENSASRIAPEGLKDDDAGMMWGDCGRLYFWIRKADLAEGRFDKCWMILQCS